MCFNAGFFPCNYEVYGKKFADTMIDAFSHADICGYWELGCQGYFVDIYGNSQLKLVPSAVLGPAFDRRITWSKMLKRKKVLVIHPFEATIIEQYKKRKEIWPDRECLPEFKLLTLKAVQTMANHKDERSKDWFVALDYMMDKIREIDTNEGFDIALIACGAYGMPLAAMIKQLGKQSIHIGGSLQLLFGIMGGRWDNDNIYNDAWIRPLPEDMIDNYKKIESGCYW